MPWERRWIEFEKKKQKHKNKNRKIGNSKPKKQRCDEHEPWTEVNKEVPTTHVRRRKMLLKREKQHKINKSE
jgi:hypothetical protein